MRFDDFMRILPFVFFFLTISGCTGIVIYESGAPERDIKKHGEVIRYVESVTFDRRYASDPMRYYKMRTAVHEDGTYKKESYTRRIEISEWEYNNFMEKHFKE